nr:collagen-like protein [Paenibacillus lemnae]
MTGPEGAAGATGPIGPTGPAGTAASLTYGYIFQSTAQEVPVGVDVTFDSNGTLFGGILHTVGDAEITITDPGNYKVLFSVTGQQANQFAIFLDNGTDPVPGSIYGSADVDQQNTGFVIITVADSAVVTLRNHVSAGAVLLETLAGGTEANVTASILIQRL